MKRRSILAALLGAPVVLAKDSRRGPSLKVCADGFCHPCVDISPDGMVTVYMGAPTQLKDAHGHEVVIKGVEIKTFPKSSLLR